MTSFGESLVAIMSIKFVVRYWSSLLPDAYRGGDGTQRWVDYSVHPASKLGLHNAMLAVHDRLEILEAHGGEFDCAVFVVEDEHTEKLSQENANELFSALPRGEVKWLDIHEFVLPQNPEEPAAAETSVEPPVSEQLPLFGHVHTPYDDLDIPPHILDVDA